MCRWEILELATGAPTIYGSSLPANTTGPQVLSLQQAPLQPAFPAPSHPTFLKTHLSQSLLNLPHGMSIPQLMLQLTSFLFATLPVLCTLIAGTSHSKTHINVQPLSFFPDNVLPPQGRQAMLSSKL